MDNKINKIAQAIFLYLEDIGPCEVSVHCYGEDIENIGSFQPTTLRGSETHNKNKKMPMISTFRNFFKQYTEDNTDDLIRRVDFDINDYHELVFKINPEEKKIEIKSFCYFLGYTPYEYEEKTPNHIVDMMNDEEVSYFVIEFWAGYDDYGFRYEDVEGSEPGFVKQFENYFVKFLNKKATGWNRDTGSEGTFNVNKNTIYLEITMKDEEFRSSGFYKEIKI